MSIPVVWSEREYPHYRDCVFSAWLDVLVYAGFKEFPLGIYSNDEREQLERAGSHIPETATTMAQASENSINRYHINFRAPDVPLSTALTRVGTGIILFGRNGNLPAGDSWRRWDPTFDGIHSVSIFPLGNGYSQVLDPEAWMGFPGDKVPNSKILKWASGVGDWMWARENEFQRKFLGWRCDVGPGIVTFYKVERYTHKLYAPRFPKWDHVSHAPVAHGIPGFWMITQGGLTGYYLVYGHSGIAFKIDGVYRLGNGSLSYVPVDPSK